MHILFLVGVFLLGSFPTGVVVARAKGVDLRKVGSGNIGTTNVGRALGRGWAALVLLVDAGKGALPVVLAAELFEQTWLPAAAGLVAVLGQVFSIFLKGRGGKGVATSLGAGLALHVAVQLLSLAGLVGPRLVHQFGEAVELAAGNDVIVGAGAVLAAGVDEVGVGFGGGDVYFSAREFL